MLTPAAITLLTILAPSHPVVMNVNGELTALIFTNS
jgi:hypothetical protein